MAISITRGRTDPKIEKLMEALEQYSTKHPVADISLYRQNSVSVRIRIVDPSFKDRGRQDRHKAVWKYLGRLPEEVLSDVSMLLLLTPEEQLESFANQNFEHPIPSKF